MVQAGFEPAIPASERPPVFVYSFSGQTTVVAATIVTSATVSLGLRPLTVPSNMTLRTRWVILQETASFNEQKVNGSCVSDGKVNVVPHSQTIPDPKRWKWGLYLLTYLLHGAESFLGS